MRETGDDLVPFTTGAVQSASRSPAAAGPAADGMTRAADPPAADPPAADPPAASEEDLVARARAGDRDAFAALVDRHAGRVWGLVWRIVRHREDTEDVVQEVFLTAWRHLPDFRGDASLGTWLQRIAVTRSLNHRARGAEKVRRASRPLEGSSGESDEGGTAAPEPADPRPDASPLAALEARELARRLADCMRRLPAAWRAALALRDGDSRTYEEMAVALGVALGTVRSRLARARLALRDCVEGRT